MDTAYQLITGSRLHFGMLGFGRRGERAYGGCGAMVDGLPLRIAIRPAPGLRVTGCLAERARHHVLRLVRRWDLEADPPLHLHVAASPPSHVGLGVGTQLGLAIALLVRAFLNQPSLSIRELAAAAGRGRRSAVGTYGFEQGGMVAEAGSDTAEGLAPLLTRFPLPSRWRFVLLLPATEDEGLSGNPEEQAFRALPPVPQEVTAELCRELLLHLLPAARSAHFEEFSASLYRYGRMSGECFAGRQGGPFASPQLASWVDRIRAAGFTGVGQSSWGPVLFAAADSAAQASGLVRLLADDAQADSRRLVVVTPRNTATELAEVSPDDPSLFGLPVAT